jgi:type III secretory pathway component EscS
MPIWVTLLVNSANSFVCTVKSTVLILILSNTTVHPPRTLIKMIPFHALYPPVMMYQQPEPLAWMINPSSLDKEGKILAVPGSCTSTSASLPYAARNANFSPALGSLAVIIMRPHVMMCCSVLMISFLTALCSLLSWQHLLHFMALVCTPVVLTVVKDWRSHELCSTCKDTLGLFSEANNGLDCANIVVPSLLL